MSLFRRERERERDRERGRDIKSVKAVPGRVWATLRKFKLFSSNAVLVNQGSRTSLRPKLNHETTHPIHSIPSQTDPGQHRQKTVQTFPMILFQHSQEIVKMESGAAEVDSMPEFPGNYEIDSRLIGLVPFDTRVQMLKPNEP